MKWTNKDGKQVEMAKAKCKKCGDVMESKMPGDWVRCSCGASYVDTDRWSPERHRYGSEAQWGQNDQQISQK